MDRAAAQAFLVRHGGYGKIAVSPAGDATVTLTIKPTPEERASGRMLRDVPPPALIEEHYEAGKLVVARYIYR